MKTKSIFLFYVLIFNFTLHAQYINKNGKIISERFIHPRGYERKQYAADSFQTFLRTFPLKPYDSPVMFYDGRIKISDFHISVFDFPLLKQDLIQCADAVIKLRAEYLYLHKRYNEIIFTITNGEKIPFKKFSEGFRKRE